MATENEKYVYDFSEGKKELKNLLGGKGANLAEMTKIGLNIPQGFTLTTTACLKYYEAPKKVMETIKPAVLDAITRLEEKYNKKFGDLKDPLLVSVRSGAPMSMPGMFFYAIRV